jgi:hypothetical protein
MAAGVRQHAFFTVFFSCMEKQWSILVRKNYSNFAHLANKTRIHVPIVVSSAITPTTMPLALDAFSHAPRFFAKTEDAPESAYGTARCLSFLLGRVGISTISGILEARFVNEIPSEKY